MTGKQQNEREYDVLAYGELLWDLLPSGKVIGGAPGNCANRMNLFGLRVGLISRLGDDELGHEARSLLQSLGLDTSLLQMDATLPTGTVDVQLSAEGNPTFTIVPNVAYDNIELSDQLVNYARKSSFICFGTLVQRSRKSRATLYDLLDAVPETRRFLDINLRKDCFSKESIENSLRRADVLKLNKDEVTVLSQMLGFGSLDVRAFGEKLFEMYRVKSVLVTLGEAGVFCIIRGEAPLYVPGCSVNVADTIGAGDAFSAGFVAKTLEGASIADCLDYANALAAVSATKKGGMGALSKAEVDSFLGGKHKRVIVDELRPFMAKNYAGL